MNVNLNVQKEYNYTLLRAHVSVNWKSEWERTPVMGPHEHYNDLITSIN